MASSEFHIVLQFKTPEGFEPFGRFEVGRDHSQAESIFNNLKGNHECSFSDVLQIDLVESGNGLPKPLKMMSCSLQDIGENCRIITRECFKYRNLEP
jgi:hypothetical protein